MAAKKAKSLLPRKFLDELELEAFNDFHTQLTLAGLIRVAKGSRHEEIGDLALSYALCVEATVGKFADLLTQAVIARGRAVSSQARLEVVREALSLASLLEEVAIGTLSEEIPIPPRKEKQFMKQLSTFLHEWTTEAERKVELRCILTLGGTRLKRQPETGPKAAIGYLKDRCPEISHKGICARLDGFNDRSENEEVPYPVPDSWFQENNDRTWSGNLRHKRTKKRVKTFISKVEPIPPKKLKRPIY